MSNHEKLQHKIERLKEIHSASLWEIDRLKNQIRMLEEKVSEASRQIAIAEVEMELEKAKE